MSLDHFVNQPSVTTDRKPLVLEMESAIRDLAGTVIASCHNRKNHPSYGYTKAMIRASLERLEGAVGLYMVVTQQASHASIPSTAKFLDGYTSDRVAVARSMVADL